MDSLVQKLEVANEKIKQDKINHAKEIKRLKAKSLQLSGNVSENLVDMIFQSLGEAGGVDYLKMQAERNPRDFMKLLTHVVGFQKKTPLVPLNIPLSANTNNWQVEFVKPNGLLEVPDFIEEADIID